jgi:integrase
MSSHAFREKGIAVRIYRRGSSPTWTASFRVDGRKIQKSTEHDAKDRAIAKAKSMVADELRTSLSDVKPGSDLTWQQLFDLHARDKLPRMTKAWATSSKARRTLLESCFGAETRVADLDQEDVDHYAHQRTSGTLYPPGMNRERKAVSVGTVEAEIRWLQTVLRWAARRKVDGKRLLPENPLDDVVRPAKNENALRPITSEDRYAKTLAKCDEVDPKSRLRAMLALARFTGRRIGSISQLRVLDVLWSTDDVDRALAERGQDVRLAAYYPHGAVRWSAEFDKLGLGWITPMHPDLVVELERYRQRSGRIGDTPLFGAPGYASVAISAALVGRWLLRAEAKAALPRLAGGRWHPYRRLFASELAHVPAKVAATLGGWKDTETMVNIYQQPAGADLYRAALDVRKMRG